AGGMVRSLRGSADIWDSSRRVPGCYAVYLDFEDGTVASVINSGYDHFDSRELVQREFSVDPANHAKARRELLAAPDVDWESRGARGTLRWGAHREQRAPTSPAIVGVDHGRAVDRKLR